jgi:hypothetical protein
MNKYEYVGIVELIIFIVLDILTLWLTYIGISSGIATEGNPSALFMFSSLGYNYTGILDVAILLMIFLGTIIIGNKISMPYLVNIVMLVMIAVKFVDFYHDLTLLQTCGGVISIIKVIDI